MLYIYKIFKIISVDSEKIIYSFSFFKDIEEVFEYGIDFVTEEREKSIDYLFALLQITKDLPQEVKEHILYRTLILEFREEYFIEYFNFKFPLDLELFSELDQRSHSLRYSSDNTRYSLDSFYYLSD